MEIKVAGKYRLLQTIGQGGFGDVYKAEDAKTGKIRAIKLERRVSGEMIFFESRVLKYLQDVVGLPKLHDFGCAIHQDIPPPNPSSRPDERFLNGKSMAGQG